MSVNRYLPHVFVLPEDDANEQLVNGFFLDHSLVIGKIHVLPVAGGWTKVLDCFKSDHVFEMDRYPDRYMVLLIDFDGDQERLAKARAVIPMHLRERVFVLGAWTDPQALSQAKLGSFEDIGLKMARDCREGTNVIWSHDLLRHNASELDRLCERVCPILFA